MLGKHSSSWVICIANAAWIHILLLMHNFEYFYIQSVFQQQNSETALKLFAESKHIWPVQSPAAISVHLLCICQLVATQCQYDTQIGLLSHTHDFLQTLYRTHFHSVCNSWSDISLLRRIFSLWIFGKKNALHSMGPQTSAVFTEGLHIDHYGFLCSHTHPEVQAHWWDHGIPN